MIYKSHMLESAEVEFNGIIDYLNLYSKPAAQRFIDEFENSVDLICSGILEGRLSRMPKLAKLGYHSVLFNDYVFLYYIENDYMVIAHIFHQKQDYAQYV